MKKLLTILLILMIPSVSAGFLDDLGELFGFGEEKPAEQTFELSVQDDNNPVPYIKKLTGQEKEKYEKVEIKDGKVCKIEKSDKQKKEKCDDIVDGKLKEGTATLEVVTEATNSIILTTPSGSLINVTLRADWNFDGNYTDQLNNITLYTSEMGFSALYESDLSDLPIEIEVTSSLPYAEQEGISGFMDGSQFVGLLVSGTHFGKEYVCSEEGANCTTIQTEQGFSVRGFDNDGLIDPSFYLPITEPSMILENIRGEFTATQNITHLSINDTGERHAVFDGEDDYLSTNSINVSTFTIMGWFKPIGTPRQMKLIHKEGAGGGLTSGEVLLDNYALGTFDVLRYGLHDGTSSYSYSTPSGTFKYNEWQLFVWTFNGTDLVVYRNSTEIDRETIALTSLPALDFNWQIGAREMTTVEWNGSMDELMIFNRALSASEVTDLYALNRGDYTPNSNLVMYYSFDTPGSVFTDQSWRGNDATVGGNVFTQQDTTLLNNLWNDLVAYYPFDIDSSTTAYDLSGNRLNGTYIGNAVSQQGGVFDDAATFDGDTDSISLNYNFIGGIKSNYPTAMAWVYPTDIAAQRQVFGFQLTQYGLGVRNGYYFIDYKGGAAHNTTIPVTLNEWHHVAMSPNGTHINFYYDGVLSFSGIDSGTVSFDSGTYHFIGRYYTTTTTSWNGSLDDFMLFSSSLNSSQIQDIYTNQSPRFHTSGIQTHPFIVLNESVNSVNISVSSFERNYSSEIYGRVGYWDVSKGYNDSDDVSNGLVGYWHGDDTGEERHAGFDGTGDYLTTLDNNSLPGAITFSGWMKAQNSSDIPLFGFSSTVNYPGFLMNGASGRPLLYLGSANFRYFTDTGVPYDGQWHHIAVVLNGSDQNSVSSSELYIDGVNQSVYFTTATGGQAARTTFLIGRRGFSYYNGNMDDILIFNRTLSKAEIQALNASGRSANYAGDPNLVADYRFDDQTFVNSVNGVFATRSGDVGISSQGIGGIDGIMTNGMNISTAGKFNSSFQFDGVNDYVTFNSFTRNHYTISTWIQSPNLSAFDATYGAGIVRSTTNSPTIQDFILNVDNDGAIRFFIWENAGGADADGQHKTPDGTITTNQWYHVVGTYDGADARVYVNGISHSLAQSSTGTSWGTENSIGRSYTSAGYFFKGNIDEVMIFNRTLSPDEIKQLYIKGRANWSYTDWKVLDSNGVSANHIIDLESENTLNQFSMNSTGFYTPYIKNQAVAVSTFADIYPPKIYYTSTPNGQINNSYTVGIAGEDLLYDNPQSLNLGLYVLNSTGDLVNFTLTSENSTIDLSFLPSDNYTHILNGTDASGNFNTTTSRTIVFDKDAPLPVFGQGTSIPGGSLEGQDWLYFNATATDLHTFIGNITITIKNSTNELVDNHTVVFNAGVYQEFQYNATSLSYDSYNVTISACDYPLGQCNTSTVIKEYTLSPDLTPPNNITFIQPVDGGIYTTDSITFEIFTEDLGSGIFNTSYWNDPFTVNYTYSGSPEVRTVAQGNQTWIAETVDLFGNSNRTNISFFVDSEAPSIMILEPRENDIYSGNSTALNVTGSDTNGISSWRYTLFNSYEVVVNNQSFTPNATLEFTTTQNYSVIVYANDSFGTWGSAQRNFRFVYVNYSDLQPGQNGTGFYINQTPATNCTTSGWQYWGWLINSSGDYNLNWTSVVCDGEDGAEGPQGPEGPTGPPGVNGTAGLNGTTTIIDRTQPTSYERPYVQLSKIYKFGRTGPVVVLQ